VLPQSSSRVSLLTTLSHPILQSLFSSFRIPSSVFIHKDRRISSRKEFQTHPTFIHSLRITHSRYFHIQIFSIIFILSINNSTIKMFTKTVLAVSALAAAASAQGVTALITPTTPAPAGCSANAATFNIAVVNASTASSKFKVRTDCKAEIKRNSYKS